MNGEASISQRTGELRKPALTAPLKTVRTAASKNRVGDDTCRNLEDHLADGEEGVRGERLGVAQSGVKEEEGVDAPDE